MSSVVSCQNTSISWGTYLYVPANTKKETGNWIVSHQVVNTLPYTFLCSIYHFKSLF